MQSIPLWILAVSGLLFVTLQGFHNHKSPVAGRYQLGNGTITGFDDHTEPALVKIDTVTGQTWRLNFNLVESKTTPGEVLTTKDGQPLVRVEWNEIY